MNCAETRDLIPLHAADEEAELPPTVVQHLRGCADCAAEFELVRALRSARPEVPAGLEARVRAAVRADRTESTDGGGEAVGGGPVGRPTRSLPGWTLGVAALLALAVGTPLLVEWTGEGSDSVDGPEATGEMLLASVWATGDGLIAGAPMFDELSDEELRALLDELEEDA